MACSRCSHSQDGIVSYLPELYNELERVISQLAFSRRTLLDNFNELRIAFEKLIERSEGDVLWRTNWVVTPTEATNVTIFLGDARGSFQRTLSEIEQPLQLAERAARQLLVTPCGNASYEASSDVDIDAEEVQRRITESHRSDFWRRVALRLVRGMIPQLESPALKRAEHEVGAIRHAIKHWLATYTKLKTDMREVEHHLKRAILVLITLSEQKRDTSEQVSQELTNLADEVVTISTLLNETVTLRFKDTVSSLMDIMKSVAAERDELYC